MFGGSVRASRRTSTSRFGDELEEEELGQRSGDKRRDQGRDAGGVDTVLTRTAAAASCAVSAVFAAASFFQC